MPIDFNGVSVANNAIYGKIGTYLRENSVHYSLCFGLGSLWGSCSCKPAQNVPRCLVTR